MELIKWTKPSGVEIQTNDREETIEYCESLGWKREGEKKKAGRPPNKDKSTD